MANKIYVVRSVDSYEPDWRDTMSIYNGVDYWTVSVPEEIPESDVFDAFQMAEEYANAYEDFEMMSDEEGIENYDQHFPMMREKYTGNNGYQIFNSYLEDACGWRTARAVQEYQYSYEW